MRHLVLVVLILAFGCDDGEGGGTDSAFGHIDGGHEDAASIDGSSEIRDGGPSFDSGLRDGAVGDLGTPDSGPVIEPDQCGWQAVSIGAPIGSHPIYGSAAKDPAGGIAVAWRDPAHDLLWLRRGGGPAELVAILQDPNGSLPRIAFDGVGALHLFFGMDGRIQHTYETIGGWATEHLVGDRPSNLTVASAGGTIMVAYLSSGVLRLSTWAAGEWSHEVIRERWEAHRMRAYVDASGAPYLSSWSGGRASTVFRRGPDGWVTTRADGASDPVAMVVDARGWPHIFAAANVTAFSWSWDGRGFERTTSEIDPDGQVLRYGLVIDDEDNRYGLVQSQNRLLVVEPETGALIASLSGEFTHGGLIGAEWSDGSLYIVLSEPTSGGLTMAAFKPCAEGVRGRVLSEMLAQCDGAEVDLTTDSAHCGACGSRCSDAQLCVDGWCVCPGLDAVACGDQCDPGNEARKCAEPTLAPCGDIASDPQNCGTCGNACDPGALCERGQCACAGSVCDGVCKDTQNDADNCGECGKVCPFGCELGECVQRRLVLIDECEDIQEARWQGWRTLIDDATLEAATQISAQFRFRVNYYSTALGWAVDTPDGEHYEADLDTRTSDPVTRNITIDRETAEVIGEWTFTVYSWTNGAGPQAEICGIDVIFE